MNMVMQTDFEDEQNRELMIEAKHDCKVIRIDPDAGDFSIYRLINQVCMHIKQSTLKWTKMSLIDDLSRE